MAAAAAAGQQWYAGRQQEHVAGAQIPVALGIGVGIGSVLNHKLR